MIKNIFKNNTALLWVAFAFLFAVAIYNKVLNPYLWFDESIFFYQINHASTLDLLIPGKVNHFLGVQSLLLTILSVYYNIFSFIPVIFLVLFFNLITLFFILRELIIIFKKYDIPIETIIFFGLIFCSNPAVLFYISDARPYLFEILISTFFTRKYLLKQTREINIFVYVLTFFVSIQASIVLGTLTVLDYFQNKSKNNLIKIIFLSVSSLIYFYSIKINHPQYLIFMNKYWNKLGALSFSDISNLLSKMRNLLSLSLNSNSFIITLLILLLLTLNFRKNLLLIKLKMTLFLVFILLSLIGKYPVIGGKEHIIFLDLRVNISLFIIFLILNTLSMASYQIKHRLVFISFILLFSVTDYYLKFDKTFAPRLANIENINIPVKTINELDKKEQYCLVGVLAQIYWVNTHYNLVNKLDNVRLYPNYHEDEFARNRPKCEIIILSWENISNVVNVNLLDYKGQFRLYKKYRFKSI